MTHRKYKYPQPTEEQLDQEPVYWKAFNEYWWALVQQKIGGLLYSDRWDDFTVDIEQAIYGLMSPDDPVSAEWIAVFDFLADNGGFSVVSGEGGQWVSGSGWQATLVGSAVQAHIERSFEESASVGGFLIFYITGSNVSFTRELALTIQVAGTETTWYFTNPAATNTVKDILVDGSVVEDGTRLRIRNYQSGGSGVSVRIIRLLVWGEGNDPFES